MIAIATWIQSKIIETPTYIEIWEYEQLILTKRKTDNDEKKEKPDWLKTTKQTFDDLTAQGQYDSLKRKQKHYKINALSLLDSLI